MSINQFFLYKKCLSSSYFPPRVFHNDALDRDWYKATIMDKTNLYKMQTDTQTATKTLNLTKGTNLVPRASCLFDGRRPKKSHNKKQNIPLVAIDVISYFFCRVTFPCYKKKEDISLAESYVISHVIRWNVFFCFSKFASCEILGIFQSNTFSKQVDLFRSIDCEILGIFSIQHIFKASLFISFDWLRNSRNFSIQHIFKASLFISFDWLRNSRNLGVRLTNVKRKIF